MRKSITHIEFLGRIKNIFPDLEILDTYNNSTKYILVEDIDGIEYLTKPTYLLCGWHPTIRLAIDKTKAFKIELSKIQPNLNVIGEYKGSQIKILIEDSLGIKHLVVPNNLLKGLVPNILSAVDRNEAFEIQSRNIHGDKYDYSEVIYQGDVIKVKIKCPIHGIFEQLPTNHLQGIGCWKCGKEKQYKSTVEKRKEHFIELSTKKHNGKYDYSKVIYKNNSTKVKIKCPKHGYFMQNPNNHIRGIGCPKCNRERLKREKPNAGMAKRDWVQFCKDTNTKEARLYIIHCYDGNEQFIKIGITKHDVSKRFRNVYLPYKYEVIKLIKDIPERIYDLEKQLHKEYRNFKYYPKLSFGGETECYSELIKEIILN